MNSCCMSMSTVNATPGICQNSCCCNCSASVMQSTLNAVGKWGVSLAGIATGRAVQAGPGGVRVAPSAQQAALTAQANVRSYMPIIIIAVIAVVVLVLFRK
jgi:hypothetical protein